MLFLNLFILFLIYYFFFILVVLQTWFFRGDRVANTLSLFFFFSHIANANELAINLILCLAATAMKRIIDR